MNKEDLTLATNPERMEFKLGEAVGGGSADGMELLVLEIQEWTGEDGVYHTAAKVVFGRKSCEFAIKAMATYLSRDEDDREEDRRRHASELEDSE